MSRPVPRHGSGSFCDDKVFSLKATGTRHLAALQSREWEGPRAPLCFSRCVGATKESVTPTESLSTTCYTPIAHVYVSLTALAGRVA